MKEKNIILTEQEQVAMLKIWNRYYSGLFNSIIYDEEEEFELRDTLASIADKIKGDK